MKILFNLCGQKKMILRMGQVWNQYSLGIGCQQSVDEHVFYHANIILIVNVDDRISVGLSDKTHITFIKEIGNIVWMMKIKVILWITCE